MHFKKDPDVVYSYPSDKLKNFLNWWRTDTRASWIIHFVEFFILAKWTGIYTAWAFAFVLFIELWEAIDWSWPKIWKWFTRFDTWIDMLIGSIAIITAKGLWPIIWNFLK